VPSVIRRPPSIASLAVSRQAPSLRGHSPGAPRGAGTATSGMENGPPMRLRSGGGCVRSSAPLRKRMSADEQEPEGPSLTSVQMAGSVGLRGVYHDISNTWLAHGYSSSSLTTQAHSRSHGGPPKSPPVRSPPVTPPPPSGRVGRHSREADRFSGALTNPCQPMPKSRGRKPKKHRAPATAAPKKRLDTFSTTPQVSPLSTQPPQEPPPATAPRQEQPASKIKQIAKRMMPLWHWLRTTC